MSETFTLSIPYSTAAGVKLESLSLRRLQVKDLKAVRKISDKAEDWDDLLIARSSGLPPEDLDGMDLADYLALQKRFQHLTGVVASSENTDSGAGAAGEVVSVSAK
ncbi:phage tail assembly protein [Pectobacterium brasiliense]|uniref:Phage tail assembly protein n=1 Tax=Pectobacterium brasiliense TaxID=180957 RepID=A0AAW9H486_9GAMM|nr:MULTISPECIES: phage tail assembly protein [Pectobacterium]KHS67350.1 mu-like prophage FluMu gp41 family protein [Pectobacterium brasiliense]MBN3132642.1 phage tail assembly protein [Pectobacterium brasiliense]MBN3250561.1 phage tail assembly protein [Pectobacterium brasiliense]MBN3258336.1 phage tail assembly protein [Pectobacterium brasiliense]MDY4378640.1 phage tail assembly protein [Pectobacterium brasiliense]